MKFKSVLVGKANRNGRKPSMAKSELVYNTTKGHTRKDGTYVLSCVFYIGMDIMKQARMMVGDRAEVLKNDCGGYGLIKRVNEGGVKVGMNGKSRNCAKVSFIKTEALPEVRNRATVQNVVISDEGILFDWPKEDA